MQVKDSVMLRHIEISDAEIRKQVKQIEIIFGGNLSLKIYGKLNYHSGKKMKKQNRVFFGSEKEAIKMGFRPCGNCMNKKYKLMPAGR